MSKPPSTHFIDLSLRNESAAAGSTSRVQLHRVSIP